MLLFPAEESAGSLFTLVNAISAEKFAGFKIEVQRPLS
ncbi:hypothetical protein L248_2073 [Schleiferilactobacillus shenzhenensis LY-73]|uniref:Uncharacterized protein n=1 Tax=Schleiferilactobacillus shenzhenensis LY-73 TaxID=1231336 RepID=U4TXC4_9LACO|nr:hypothetical protein L248_2073 [Schleiferilactobacillus shenzhenensis LY-73]